VRSVTIVLENMGGVAFTKGNELDDDHKEIHISTSYIEHCHSRAREELLGVLVHEMVHCFQFNGKGTCPGGLIEGIAGTKPVNLYASSNNGSFHPNRFRTTEGRTQSTALAERRGALGRGI
jgi:hypothetical protein